MSFWHRFPLTRADVQRRRSGLKFTHGDLQICVQLCQGRVTFLELCFRSRLLVLKEMALQWYRVAASRLWIHRKCMPVTNESQIQVYNSIRWCTNLEGSQPCETSTSMRSRSLCHDLRSVKVPRYRHLVYTAQAAVCRSTNDSHSSRCLVGSRHRETQPWYNRSGDIGGVVPRTSVLNASDGYTYQ